MKRRLLLGVLLLGLSTSAATRKTKPPLAAGEPNPDPRTLVYTQGARIQHVYTMKDWATVILLPKGEKYLDFFTGEPTRDKNNLPWILNAPKDADYVTVSPNTNHLPYTTLTIMTDSKNSYILILDDVTKTTGAHADTLVKVELNDESMQRQVGHKAYVDIEQFNALKALNESLEVKLEDQAREDARELARVRREEHLANVTAPRTVYVFKSPKKAKHLGLHQMWTDGERTYADKVPTTETAAFYEEKDGGPLFTNWEYKDGHYFIPHKVEKGYFLVGKKKANKVRVVIEGQS